LISLAIPTNKGNAMNIIDRVINARMAGWHFAPSKDEGMRVEFTNPKSLCTFCTNGTIVNALMHIEEFDLLEEYGYAEQYGQCAFCEWCGILHNGPEFPGNICDNCVSEL